MKKTNLTACFYALACALILSACAKPEPIIPGVLIQTSYRAPLYPMLSMDIEEDGIVQLRLHADTNGQITEVELVKSSGYPRLDRSAQKTAKNWRFTSAMQGKKAVPFQYKQNVTFTLPRR